MAKRAQQYEIREAVRGSFIGALGRVRYDVEAGVRVASATSTPRCSSVLIASGAAARVKAEKPAESEESA